MNKPEEYIYPFATALFVFGALSQTLFMPIIGGINGFAILFLLLVKFFVGKMREKATAAVTANLSASPAENSEEETGALSAASNLPTGKMPGMGGMAGGSSIGKANLYVLLIDYLTSPMNKFEKGILLLGWALWPILFPLVPMIIIVAIKDQCTVLGVDICGALAGIVF